MLPPLYKLSISRYLFEVVILTDLSIFDYDPAGILISISNVLNPLFSFYSGIGYLGRIPTLAFLGWFMVSNYLNSLILIHKNSPPPFFIGYLYTHAWLKFVFLFVFFVLRLNYFLVSFFCSPSSYFILVSFRIHFQLSL